MTLEELKQRILSTGYLPEWLKDSVDLMGSTSPTYTLPVTAPPQPDTKRWCPFSRVRLAQLSGQDSFNRLVAYKGSPEAGSLVTEVVTTGSFCIEGACQMWNGQDCGLKASPAGLQEAVAAMQTHQAATMDRVLEIAEERKAMSVEQFQKLLDLALERNQLTQTHHAELLSVYREWMNAAANTDPTGA